MLALRLGRVDVWAMLDEIDADALHQWKAAAAIEGWFPLECWEPSKDKSQKPDDMQAMLARKFG